MKWNKIVSCLMALYILTGCIQNKPLLNQDVKWLENANLYVYLKERDFPYEHVYRLDPAKQEKKRIWSHNDQEDGISVAKVSRDGRYLIGVGYWDDGNDPDWRGIYTMSDYNLDMLVIIDLTLNSTRRYRLPGGVVWDFLMIGEHVYLLVCPYVFSSPQKRGVGNSPINYRMSDRRALTHVDVSSGNVELLSLGLPLSYTRGSGLHDLSMHQGALYFKYWSDGNSKGLYTWTLVSDRPAERLAFPKQHLLPDGRVVWKNRVEPLGLLAITRSANPQEFFTGHPPIYSGNQEDLLVLPGWPRARSYAYDLVENEDGGLYFLYDVEWDDPFSQRSELHIFNCLTRQNVVIDSKTTWFRYNGMAPYTYIGTTFKKANP